MAKNSSAARAGLRAGMLKEPRVVARIALGALLAANLAAAVIAFQPFGASTEAQLREQASLAAEWTRLQEATFNAKRTVDKVEMARNEGGQFLDRYVLDGRVASSGLIEELNRMAKESGVKMLASAISEDAIEGTETLVMWSVSPNFEGDYQQIKKFVEMVDKSKRFLIIEQMNVTSPQQQVGGRVTVAMKLDAFVRSSGEVAE